MEDPIVAEVRRVREEHAAQHDYDLDRIYESLKQLEDQAGLQTVTYAPQLPTWELSLVRERPRRYRRGGPGPA